MSKIRFWERHIGLRNLFTLSFIWNTTFTMTDGFIAFYREVDDFPVHSFSLRIGHFWLMLIIYR